MATTNRKTRYQLNLNSTRTRFDVNKTLELNSLHYQACVAKVLKKSLEPFWRFSKKH